MSTFPVPPQYEPDQIVAIHADELAQRRQPATPATWIVGIVLIVAVVAWMTLVVTRSHETSAPATTASPAAPRSAAPAR